ncbi:hypothetical protein E3N88_30381 [Mikania micrantha]|uniref:Uncharacterized protein n=1 Tax=Mikania micrantha TaxID=192012 RepID=A0A5N6MNM7_9ASTR|nr:hypothetical protein E3N88_30381 [Mikania micrantha]
MKLGLLGSAETHRDTRWAHNWAFAVREAQAGEFEFSEKRRDAFLDGVAVRDRPIIAENLINPMLIILLIPYLFSRVTSDYSSPLSPANHLQTSGKPFGGLREPIGGIWELGVNKEAPTITLHELKLLWRPFQPAQSLISAIQGVIRMADNNGNANRNPGKRPAVDDLTEDSRRRIDSIVAQVDAEMERRTQMLARERYWGWLPSLLLQWIVAERVPTPRYRGDTSEGPRLPALGMPMERAFAAHVAVTRRELRRNAELSDEVRVLREKNDRLERRSDRLEEQNDRLEEQVETLRLQVSQLMSQHGQIVDVMQEHDGRITENRTDIAETQAMVQASDAMLNAWAAQFVEEPPAEDDGPQFEAEDLEEGEFDEDPDEDPEEDDDDDGDAASNISHVSMDSD